jgi:hypothetical protein
MVTADEDLERLVRDRLAELAPGWSRTVSIDDGAVVVELSHPYSEGLIFHSRAGVADEATVAAEWIDRCLRSDELTWQVRLFANAPGPTGDGHAIRGLGAFGEMFVWSNMEVRAVAGLLVDSSALSDAEFEWARRSLGDDAPDGPGPNPPTFSLAQAAVRAIGRARIVDVALDCADPEALAGALRAVARHDRPVARRRQHRAACPGRRSRAPTHSGGAPSAAHLAGSDRSQADPP